MIIEDFPYAKASGIYLLTNTVNGKMYVGSSKDMRVRCFTHKSNLMRNKHCNSHLQAAWNKYGPDSFIFEVAEYVSDTESLRTIEQEWIDNMCVTNNKVGYNKNLRAGADCSLGMKRSPEAKAKMRAAKLGRKHTPTHAAARSKAVTEWWARRKQTQLGAQHG